MPGHEMGRGRKVMKGPEAKAEAKAEAEAVAKAEAEAEAENCWGQWGERETKG